jgi:hypothetical protein
MSLVTVLLPHFIEDFMKKLVAIFALCLTITASDNAFSMVHPKDHEEEDPAARYRIVQQQRPDQEPATIRGAASQIRWSDLSPNNWSFRTKCGVAVGVIFIAYACWLTYACINAILETREEMRNRPKQCRPYMDYNVVSDSRFYHLSSNALPDSEPITLILQDTIRNSTHKICRYLVHCQNLVSRAFCDAPVDFVYDKTTLQKAFFSYQPDSQ